MVHALNELRETIRRDAIVIDIRPLAEAWPVEIAWQSGQRQAGRVTDLAQGLADDEAANSAMEQGVALGLFASGERRSFPLFYYWDTPNEMKAYVTENWADFITIDDATAAEVGKTWASANADARLRIRMTMLVTRYIPGAEPPQKKNR